MGDDTHRCADHAAPERSQSFPDMPVDLSGCPDHLAPEESQLFHGSLVDLSSASKFHKKLARIVSQLRAHIKPVGRDKYELSAEVLTSLVSNRTMGVGNEYSRPADRLAHTLYWSARSIVFDLRMRRQATRKIDAWTAFFDALDTHPAEKFRDHTLMQVPVRPTGHILEERWSRPDLPQLLVDFAFNTELGHIQVEGLGSVACRIPKEKAGTRKHSDSDAELGREVTVDRVPLLTITLEGAPVAKMMAASLRGSGADIAKARKFTSKMLAGIMHELKKFLGIAGKRGRPPLGIGKEAAMLIHHERKNIRQVVEKLCPNRALRNHRHNKNCEDTVRLVAAQYYKSLSRDFRRSLPGLAKKP